MLRMASCLEQDAQRWGDPSGKSLADSKQSQLGSVAKGGSNARRGKDVMHMRRGVARTDQHKGVKGPG